MIKNKNIVLIGFMGTGKSAVGFKLAQLLGKKFIDMDREIEQITGMSINDIFKKHGEVRFRSEEKLLSEKLNQKENLVIATGGGVVLQEENITCLREKGILICLDAKPEEILMRVNRKKGSRPLLKKNPSLEDLISMLEEREHYYACADYRINTTDKGLDEVVNEIIKLIKQE